MSKLSNKLEYIEEENGGEWLPVACPQPETPTESMEFLARSWSISAKELSEALCNTHEHEQPPRAQPDHQNQASLASESSPESPRGSEDAKDIFLLQQALNPEIVSNQQLLRKGIYRAVAKKKTMGRWIKDQKERKKQEIRAYNAQLHAAVSVAGVAAAVAALSAASPQISGAKHRKNMNASSSMASAAALVASHCIEIAEDMGADHDHIFSVVNSAVNARTNGDVMTLTAGAATALRGAATLKARLHKEHGGATIALTEEKFRDCRKTNVSIALGFVAKGGDLLKRTRKGDLHWKKVSFTINSKWQVVAKMKSKHIGGTFTKKKKCVVSSVYADIPAWPGREAENTARNDYFAIQTKDRVIEFECKNKRDKQMWAEGIQFLLHLHIK